MLLVLQLVLPLWCCLQLLVLQIASAGAPSRLCWCSKSPLLVLQIASAGAFFGASSGGLVCTCWCSKSPRLVLQIASAGAPNRLCWCSKSPRLVLQIASAGATSGASPGAFFRLLCGQIIFVCFSHYVFCSQNYAIFFKVFRASPLPYLSAFDSISL